MTQPQHCSVTVPTTRLVVVGIALVAMSMGLVGAPSHALDTPAPEDANANGLIAFHRDGDIYVVAPPDGEPRLLVGGPVEDEAPTWSPDGRRLLFVRVSEGGQTMMVTDATGSNPLPLHPEPLVDLAWFDWAPDGGMVAATHAVDGVPTITVLAADGSGEIEPEAGSTWSMAGSSTWRPSGHTGGDYTDVSRGSYSLGYAWAPDGSGLAVVNFGAPGREAYLVDASTGEVQPLGWSADGEPSWQLARG